ncbi:MAG: iron transporter [Geminicoccaceae bacterium]
MRAVYATAVAAAVTIGARAEAREYFVGGPVHQHDMEIVANYLVGVEMGPMAAPMPQGPDVIHLEADVHATADNVYGYPDGAWVPYLTIAYEIEKQGSGWKTSGTLKPMTAKDGPHYADNVKMAGPGTYKVTYRFTPPEANGFYRHVDKETGVPAWWQPFAETFSFSYPQQ